MKFEIGEIVVFIGATQSNNDEVPFRPGDEVRIESIIPLNADPELYPNQQYYEIQGIAVLERCLRKRRPPEQPSAFSYDEIISMCNGTDIRPTETQVREGLKGILQPFAGLEKVGEKHG